VLPWACLGRALRPLHRVLYRIWQYLENSKQIKAGKIFCEAHNIVLECSNSKSCVILNLKIYGPSELLFSCGCCCCGCCCVFSAQLTGGSYYSTSRYVYSVRKKVPEYRYPLYRSTGTLDDMITQPLPLFSINFSVSPCIFVLGK